VGEVFRLVIRQVHDRFTKARSRNVDLLPKSRTYTDPPPSSTAGDLIVRVELVQQL
jgi:hypothetical protein